MKNPSASKLLQSVAFEKQGAASDGHGGTYSAFSGQFSTRAGYAHLRGGEKVQAARLEGGAGAARAFGQQLPQLLGGFGPLGAILGTIAAIGIPIGAVLFEMASGSSEASGESKGLTDQVSALETSMHAYSRATEQANQTTAELTKIYGAAAHEARDILKAQEELAKVNALAGLAETTKQLSEEFGGFAAKAKNIDEMSRALDRLAAKRATIEERRLGGFVESDSIKAMNAELDKTIQQLGINKASAEAFGAAIANLREAKGIVDQREAMKAIVELLDEGSGGVDNMNDETRRLYQSLLDALSSTIGFEAAIAGSKNELASATANADNLADAIKRAADNAANLVASGISNLRESEIRLKYKSDPIGAAAALAGEEFDQTVGDISGRDPIYQHALANQRQNFVNIKTAAEKKQTSLDGVAKTTTKDIKTPFIRQHSTQCKKKPMAINHQSINCASA